MIQITGYPANVRGRMLQRGPVTEMAVFGLRADFTLQDVLRDYSSERIIRKHPDSIFREGQKAHGFYLVVRGSVRLYMEPVPGNKLIERVAGEGCVVGLPATVNSGAYSLSCEVAEDAVELAYLSLRDFSKLVERESVAAMKLLCLLSGEIQAARAELARSARGAPRSASLTN